MYISFFILLNESSLDVGSSIHTLVSKLIYISL